jgi:hypothetical protein
MFERLQREGWPVVEEWIKDKQEETLNLEFKKKRDPQHPKLDDDDKKNIAKPLSAFANTGGGLLIFGIDAVRQTNADPERAQAIVRIKNVARFLQVVEAHQKDLVDPPVVGLEPIVVTDPATPADGILAIYIPQSIGGPHRAVKATTEVNERYYGRSSTSSHVLPHPHLAALFGRTAQPQLGLHFKTWPEGERSSRVIRFTLDLINSGRGVARQPAIRFYEAQPNRLTFWLDSVRSAGVAPGWSPPLTPDDYGATGAGDFVLRSEWDVTVFPGDSVPVLNTPGKLSFLQQDDSGVVLPVNVTLYAIDAQPVDGKGALTFYPFRGEYPRPHPWPR